MNRFLVMNLSVPKTHTCRRFFVDGEMANAKNDATLGKVAELSCVRMQQSKCLVHTKAHSTDCVSGNQMERKKTHEKNEIGFHREHSVIELVVESIHLGRIATATTRTLTQNINSQMTAICLVAVVVVNTVVVSMTVDASLHPIAAAVSLSLLLFSFHIFFFFTTEKFSFVAMCANAEIP